MLEYVALACLVALPGIALLIAGVAALVLDKTAPTSARVLNACALGVSLVAYALFATSLCLPALDTMHGVFCLVGGPLGFIGCVDPVFPWAFAWLATPTVLLAVTLTPVDRWLVRAFVLAQQCVGVALAAIMLAAPERMQLVGDAGQVVHALGPGYYLWLASLVVFTLATQLLSAGRYARARAAPV